MKTKFKFFLVLCMALSLPLVFNSCSSDDDDDDKKEENNSIVGTWNFKDVVAGEVKTNSAENDAKTALYIVKDWKEGFDDSIYTFNADGTIEVTDKSEDLDKGTYTYEDGVLTINWGREDDTNTYKASIKDGVLSLNKDITEYLNEIELDDLIAFGFSNPTDYKVTKAIVNVNFTRK